MCSVRINLINPKICEKRDRKLSIRLTEEEEAPIKDLASKFGLSMGLIARTLIRAGLKHQRKNCLILSADVGRGETA